MSTVGELWNCDNEVVWLFALKTYWLFVKPENRKLEEELDRIGLEHIQNLDGHAWYKFLLDKYFRWKFTAANRYTTSSKHLRTYESNGLDELSAIRRDLLSFDRTDIKQGLQTAQRIRGLGAAGASGLLALMFPKEFGTVDQFVLNALVQVEVLPESSIVREMNRENLRTDDAVQLIGIMRKKASENNHKFASTFWTPRKMDMILWAYGHEDPESVARV